MTTRPMFLVFALTAASTVVGALPVAHAEGGDGDAIADERAAKKHYDRGQKLFNLRKFSEAIAAFEAAFEAKPIPKILFNIGQAHRNLGEHEAAIFSFKRYLKLLPVAPNRDQVEELITELEALVEAEQARERDREADPEEDPVESRVVGSEQPPGATPVYKKWWFWTGVAIVGVAGGIGIWAATSSGRGSGPDVDLGVLPPP